FTDAAATPISAGTAPFTGQFRPEQAFSTLNAGLDPNGTWTLIMVDESNTGFTGVFNSWTITFTYGGAGGSYAWSGSPAGNGLSVAQQTVQNPGNVTPTLAGTYTYTVTYTAPNGCPASSQVTVVVNPVPTITLTSGNNNQTICQGSAIANITYSTSGATGVTVTGLPAGVSGVFNAGVFTISGTPTATGTFNYSVTPTGSCPGTAATGQIVVNQAPTANAGSPQKICAGGTITLAGTRGGSATSSK